MSNLVLCRACLSFNVRMYPIGTTRYREMYQKHTSAKFITGDGRPDTVCYLCNAQLLSFCRFIQMSQKSEKYLSQLFREGIEPTPDTVCQLDHVHKLSITSMQRSSITDHAEDLPDVEVLSAKDHKKEQVQDVAIKIESLDNDIQLIYEETEDSTLHEISSNDSSNATPVLEILDLESDEIEIGVPPSILIQHENGQADKQYIQATSPLHKILRPENSYIKTSEKIEIEVATTNIQTDKQTSHSDQNTLPKVSVMLERIPIITRSQHKNTKHSYNMDMYYHCDKCNYKCLYKDALKKHIQMHDQKRAHTCKFCSYRFRTASGLNKHIQNVHMKQDKCCICAKQFKKTLYLQRHMRLHSGTQPYICEYCDRKFNHRSTYLVHCRTHTGEKPFTCKWCTKTFNDKSNCRKHMKTHTGELYACYLCDKTYSLKSHLKQHVVEHIL